jgi:signal peptidase I
MNAFLKKLSTAIVLVIVVIALFVLGSHIPVEGNYSFRVVLSGSMEPDIPTGSVIATIPREEYGVGDVVSFSGRSVNETPTTHRIVNVDESGGKRFFVTKGDANDNEDLLRVGEGEVLGEVFLVVPYVGYVLHELSTANGRAFLVATIIVLVALALIPKGTFEKSKKDSRDET